MPGSRVWATNIVLGSMVVAAFGGILKGLSTVMENLSDSPDNHSKQPNRSPEVKPVAAIAVPETFATQAIATLATEVAAANLSPAQPVASSKAQQRNLAKSTKKSVSIARTQPEASSAEAISGNPLLTPVTYSSVVTPPEKLSNQSEFSDQTVSTEPIEVSLNDIQGHWAQYYIEFLSTRNIVRGFPNGNFRPDQVVTVAEFSRMVQKASQNSGIPPISYRRLQALTPDRSPTRADAAALLYRTIVRSETVESVTKIQVKGNVLHPGSYSLAAASDPRLGKGNNLPTLSRAIQQAGGVMPSADLSRVEIHRLNASGELKVTRINVQKLLTEGDLAQDVVVQQDDVIIVPSIATATTPSKPLSSTSDQVQQPTQKPTKPLVTQNQTAPPEKPIPSVKTPNANPEVFSNQVSSQAQ